MHVSDALISPQVGLAFWAISVGASAYAIKKIDIENDRHQLPLVGVMGAFTFAAQMINFTIPGTGASGHLSGGLLLSVLLGPHLAFLTMMSLLLIQALFFADGGLIAYGVNVFNMGLLSCYLIYPLVYKPLLKLLKKTRSALIASGIMALSLGAFSVVILTTISGVSALPFKLFLWFMIPIHIVIGLVEGVVTAAIVTYVWRYAPEYKRDVTPEVMTLKKEVRLEHKTSGLRNQFLAGALLLSGVVSLYASSHPDGLEWSIMKVASSLIESPIAPVGESIQSWFAVFRDYEIASFYNMPLSTALSGIAGSLLTFWGMALMIKTLRFFKRKPLANAVKIGDHHNE